jgi:hypothetical protein
VLPPGATTDCDCRQATAIAGEAIETAETVAGDGAAAPAPRPLRPLRPGRVRVHGTTGSHQVHALGHGYSVTLHWTAGRSRSE